MPVKYSPQVVNELNVLKQYWDAGIPEQAPFDQLPNLKALGMDKYRQDYINTGGWAGNSVDQHLGGWGKLAADAATDKGRWASIQRGVRKAAPVLGAAAAVAGVPIGGIIGKALGGGKAANAVGSLLSGHGTGLMGGSAGGRLLDQALVSQLGGKTLGDTTKLVGLTGLLGLDKTLQPPKPATPDVSGVVGKGAGWVNGQMPVPGTVGTSLGSSSLGLGPGGLGGLMGQGGGTQPQSGGLTASGIPKGVWQGIRGVRDDLLGSGGGAGGFGDAGKLALITGLMGGLKGLIGGDDKPGAPAAPAPAPALPYPPATQPGRGSGWGFNVMQDLPRFSDRSLTGLPTGDDAADYASRFRRRGLVGGY